jgi:hypothetical protein
MEEIQKQHNARIEAIDLQISKLQEDKILSFDIMFSELDKYYKEREKKREEDDKKILDEAEAILEKEKKEKEANSVTEKKISVKSQAELNKMTETELITYGTALGLVLDTKTTKAFKISQILSI